MTMKQKRTHRHKKKIYRETWSLDNCFIDWLEERLPVYLREAGQVVNLSFHKFEYKDQIYTQQEIVEKMIEDIALLRKKEIDEDTSELKQEIAELWAVVLPAMWW
jgi:hypothetical protein